MDSGHSPRWRRILEKYAPFLFKHCPREDGTEHEYGNYHWRWDDGCICHGRGRVRGWK